MEIDAGTTLCALLGDPVEHSLSPAIHNAAFRAVGLNHAYVAFRVRADEIGAAVAGIRALNLRGASVTIPHKVSALPHLDRVDPVAERIGAINTIVNEEGVLVGYNTDGDGALEGMVGAGFDPAGRRILILGSGGAARGIAFTLAMKAGPGAIEILGIESDEVSRLARDLRDRTPCPARGGGLDDEALTTALGRADALIHCTPIGMSPRTGESLVPPDRLRRDLFVFDVVYNPPRTRLLEEAAARGLRTLSGIEMFVGQGVVQFELWTGRTAPRDVMRGVIQARLLEKETP